MKTDKYLKNILTELNALEVELSWIKESIKTVKREISEGIGEVIEQQDKLSRLYYDQNNLVNRIHDLKHRRNHHINLLNKEDKNERVFW